MPTVIDVLFIVVMSLAMLLITTVAGCSLGPSVTVVPQEYCERNDYETICKGTNPPETNLDWLIREHNNRMQRD